METDLELKNIDDNQLKEADMVVDDENNLVDTEIQEVDGLIIDIDEEENLVATIVPQTPRPSLYLHSETPGGSVYWEPNVESIYLPIEGKVFDMIEECVDFYTEGVPKDININTLDLENSDKQVRNTRHRITGCKARIKVDLHPVSGKYEITKFVCKHNHQMIPKHYKHLTKKQRKMTQTEKMFVVKASTMKLGATRAHNLYSSMKGSAQYVHGMSDDFTNHIRDVNAFIGESDAQMLINKIENRKKFVPNFTFQYKVENSELVAMFWADEVDKCNYKEFGDIISFDATFRTNKYDMVFVPFTGIDNHRKCVTVGSGLLLREDTEAYTWLLRSFMTAHEKQPTMIVTDQDGAMKLAIEEVLTESKHRLCMWHIMQKIPAKICTEIYDETDFKERFNKIVWNMFMEPMEFEEKWSKLIEDFGLQNHKWMTKMFNLREMWLPAYFIDSPLFGLMRTTSRSESENAFFKSFTNHGSTLVNFMMCFESAMERQRYRQEVLDFRTFDSAPKIHTKLRIEIHAYKVYTRTIFLLVQKEIIEAVWACQILECKTEEGCEIVKVRDKRASAYRTLDTEKEKEVVQQKEYVAEYKVLRSLEDGSVECTCRHFLRYGFLCRHAFCVLKNRDIEVIPEKYILRRWRRDIIPPALRRNKNRYGEKNETIEKLTNKANDECLFLLSKDEGMLATFVEQLKTIKQEVQLRNHNKMMSTIHNGGRRGERRKSGREIALKAKTRQIRKCLCCGEKTNKHTKSTGPSNPKYVAKLTRLVVAAGEQGTTTAATEQATTTATAEQGETTTAAIEQATTTAIVFEEETNAS
ncbi:FAR1-related sequence 5-like protein [Tanacetum coccineum]